MRIKRFDYLLQVRVTDNYKRTLDDAAERFDMTPAELARLSLRTGLSVLKRKLPRAEEERPQ